MTKQYKSEAFETIHDLASGFAECGAISKREMREYDKMCLLKPAKETTLDKIRDSSKARKR